MLLHYQKYSPTGNITVLVTTPTPRSRQPGIAARLLEDVGGEQVGFVEPSTNARCRLRLQMMGGEFCGNATMSLGAMLARQANLPDGEALSLLLEVSGSADPVPCGICRDGDAWVGTVRMPPPVGIDEIGLDIDAGILSVPLVRLPGISHLIIPEGAGLDEAQLRRRLPLWNGKIGADAVGAIVWNEAASAIDPLVYVPSAGTLVREHGCGSGTAAVGCWLALLAGHGVEAPIRQPGGTITARVAVEGNAVTKLSITGRVALVMEGEYTA